MFHQWQFENIWSQSNATFNCSKLNLIDSPTNSYLLKASSIRSWFFRLLNILWFHPGFYIQLQLTFSSMRKIENAFQLCWKKKTTKGRHFQYFSSAIGCSAISCLSSTIVYILSICQSTRPPVYLQFVWIPRILQLYRTCYFLASTTQQINLYPWIIFTNCVFCRLFQSVWMLSTFKSSQKTAEQCKTFFLN